MKMRVLSGIIALAAAACLTACGAVSSAQDISTGEASSAQDISTGEASSAQDISTGAVSSAQDISTGEEPVTGGIVDETDFDAPKTIESEDLTDLTVSFYAYGEYFSDDGGVYHYELHRDDGRVTLAETDYYNVSAEVDGKVAEEAAALIRKYDLAASNGVNRVTAGLPPEYQPCSLTADYASGEVLSFRKDGDPEDEAMKAFRKLFNRAFTEAGVRETAPDPEDLAVSQFSVEFNEEALLYDYEMIDCGDKIRLMDRVWDLKTNEQVSVRYAGIEDDFLQKLSEAIEALDLQRLDVPGSASVVPTPDGYLGIHVDYESGRMIYGDYGPGEIPPVWDEVGPQLRAFLDDYIDSHLEAGSDEELADLIGNLR